LRQKKKKEKKRRKLRDEKGLLSTSNAKAKKKVKRDTKSRQERGGCSHKEEKGGKRKINRGGGRDFNHLEQGSEDEMRYEERKKKEKSKTANHPDLRPRGG